jgi:hypothetical protein
MPGVWVQVVFVRTRVSQLQASKTVSPMKAYCPRCGEPSSLFDLLPDKTKRLHSIACAACRAKRGDAVHDTSLGIQFVTCSECGAPTYPNWNFCCTCRKPITRPS